MVYLPTLKSSDISNSVASSLLSPNLNPLPMDWRLRILDFEVVISDQSTFDNLRSIVDTFDHVLNIRYVRNTSEKKNAANNVNSAVRHATGDIVKLLYMDDFFVDPFALCCDVSVETLFQSSSPSISSSISSSPIASQAIQPRSPLQTKSNISQ